MARMSTGLLRERVQLQAATTSKNAAGGTVKTWATVATVWAHVVMASGTETVESGKLSAVEAYVVTVRHRTDMTTANRVIWGSKTMDIRKVSPDPSRQWTPMVCEVTT